MLAAESSSFLTLDTNFIKPYSGGPGSNDLQFGAQYRKYIGPEGIEVTLIKNPMYDSLRYDKRRHPQYAEYPINSARMTFLDFGMSNANNMMSSNIQMLRVKDTFRYGYHAGTHTPMGPVQGAAVSALKAGYDLFTEGTGGIWIKDVTRCGELVFDDQF